MIPAPTRSARVLRKIFRRLPDVVAELAEDEERIIWSLVNLAYYRLLKKEEGTDEATARARNTRSGGRARNRPERGIG